MECRAPIVEQCAWVSTNVRLNHSTLSGHHIHAYLVAAKTVLDSTNLEGVKELEAEALGKLKCHHGIFASS